MAARTRRTHLSDEWKEKIRAGVLLDRLSKHANGEIDMSNTQIKAAEILLKKVVPDVARTEIAGDADAPLELKIGWQR